MNKTMPKPPPPKVSSIHFGPWKLTTKKSHILPSKCTDACVENGSGAKGEENGTLCPFCNYAKNLALPHLPDMVFPENSLQIEHEKGHGIEFNALDALKRVNINDGDVLKVAVTDVWSEARADLNISGSKASFDWTFSSDYKGSVFGEGIQVEPSDVKIDLEKLKEKEPLLFYDEVHLYEDELADHGCTTCTVKVRVMPSGFFALLRLYLRVDDVLVRVNDTRLYYENGKQYIIREYMSRESKVADIKVPRCFWGDPNEISKFLPVVQTNDELLSFH
nr:EOG090X07SL [Lepidurus arcticus]